MARIKISLNYNPYTLKHTSITTEDGKPLDILLPSHKNKRLQEWLYPYEVNRERWSGLYQTLASKLGVDVIELSFKGRKVDYEDLVFALQEQDLLGDIGIHFTNQGEQEEKNHAMLSLHEKVKGAPLDELQGYFMEPFDRMKKSPMSVGFFGDTGTGKSTIINALAGSKILGCDEGYCTLKKYVVTDVDSMEHFEMRFTKDGEDKVVQGPFSEGFLKEVNQDEGIKEIHILGNIEFMDDRSCNLVLVDSPGKDDHFEETSLLMKDLIDIDRESVMVMVLDANNPETVFSRRLLDQMADSIREEHAHESHRFLILVNKVHEFAGHRERLDTILEGVRRRLRDSGVKNPQVFAVDARSHLDRKLGKEDVKTLDDTKMSIGAECQELPIATGMTDFEERIRRYHEKYAFARKLYDFYEDLMSVLQRYVIAPSLVEVKSKRLRELQERLEREEAVAKKYAGKGFVVLSIPRIMDKMKKASRENEEEIRRLKLFIEKSKGKMIVEIGELAGTSPNSSTRIMHIIGITLALFSGFGLGMKILTLGANLAGFSLTPATMTRVKRYLQSSDSTLGRVRTTADDSIKKVKRSFGESAKDIKYMRKGLDMDAKEIDISLNDGNLAFFDPFENKGDLRKTLMKYAKGNPFRKVDKDGLNVEIGKILEGITGQYVREMEVKIKAYDRMIRQDLVDELTQIKKEGERYRTLLSESLDEIDRLKNEISTLKNQIEWVSDISREIESLVQI
jgi:hypothetical protein